MKRNWIKLSVFITSLYTSKDDLSFYFEIKVNSSLKSWKSLIKGQTCDIFLWESAKKFNTKAIWSIFYKLKKIKLNKTRTKGPIEPLIIHVAPPQLSIPINSSRKSLLGLRLSKRIKAQLASPFLLCSNQNIFCLLYALKYILSLKPAKSFG